MTVQILEIDQDILDSARLTPDEAKVELAVHLYGQRRLSIGKARELAGMSLWAFRQLLASRLISPHYDEADLLEDVETLRFSQIRFTSVCPKSSPLNNKGSSTAFASA